MTPVALDIIIACILLLSALVAYFRGIIREAFTIVALIVASAASYFGGDKMISSFDKWLEVDKEAGAQAAAAVSKAAGSGTDATIIAHKELVFGVADPALVSVISAYASVFIFFYLVMALAGFALSRAVAEAGLGVVDRLFGAAFGFARGFLVIFLCFLPISFLFSHDMYPEWARNSISVPILEKSVAFVDQHIDLKKAVADNSKVLLEKIGKSEPPKKARSDEAAPLRDPQRSPLIGTPEEAELQSELFADERMARPQ